MLVRHVIKHQTQMHPRLLKKLDGFIIAILKLDDPILSFISWGNDKLYVVLAHLNFDKILSVFAILLIHAGLTLNDVKEFGINIENLLLSSLLSEFIQGL